MSAADDTGGAAGGVPGATGGAPDKAGGVGRVPPGDQAPTQGAARAAGGTAAISVVVPTYRRRSLLLRVLDALAAQTLPKERFEVVVVCDGDVDGSAQAVRAWAADRRDLALTVLEQPNAGAAAARNRGARAAAAALLLFLDDDMIAAPDLVASHLDRHAASPGAIVLGAIPVDDSSPRSFLTTGLSAWAARRDARLSAAGAEVPADDVLTGQISMGRASFDALGGFDPRFTAGGAYGGEDVDFGWRARRMGTPIVYEPRAISRQVFDKTFPALGRDVRHAGAADVRMVRLHPEMAPHLLLGRVESLAGWQGRALRLTLRWTFVAAFLLAPVLFALDLAARTHRSGRLLEDLHGVARAHLYARGMKDAGYRSG